LSWNVASEKDINEESLSLFYTLDPKIEVLVLGIGDAKVTPDITSKIIAITRKFKMNVEILPTEQVCALIIITKFEILLKTIFQIRHVLHSTFSMLNND